MSLSSLSAKTDFAYDGKAYSRGRRAPLDVSEPPELKGAPPLVYENPPPAQPA